MFIQCVIMQTLQTSIHMLDEKFVILFFNVTMSTFIPCVMYEHVFMLYSSIQFTPHYEFSFKINVCHQFYY
jgi:hypothetical protein